MKYDKLLKHVNAQKITKTSRWRGFMLNEETRAIFPANKWAAEAALNENHPYNEHSGSFYFLPGNICVLNIVPIGIYDLVPYGITGKFVSRKSFKSEYTYIHELFDKYESFPGMKVSMLNGKPLNARLLDDIQCEPVALEQFEKRLREIKRVFFVWNRMSDETPRYKGTDWAEDNKNRRNLLINLFTQTSITTGTWANKLEQHYARFYSNAAGYNHQKTPDHNKVFDNMIRFDKAALFRALKVIV